MFLGISSGDWLQAGASVFGALIAIWGIYWQVNKQAKKDNENQIKFKKFQDYFNLAEEVNSIIFDIPTILVYEIDEYNMITNDPFESIMGKLLYKVENRIQFLNKIYRYRNINEKINKDIKNVENALKEFGKVSSEIDDNFDVSKFDISDPNSIMDWTDSYKCRVEKSRNKLISAINVLSNSILDYAKI